jgi:hypothetical protein
MRASALVSLFLLGCGAASVGPLPAAHRPLVPVACIVPGTAPELPLTVDPLPFPIELTGRARYVLTGDGAVAVHAEGPLALSARAALAAVPLSLGMPLRTPVVEAGVGTALAEVTLDGGRLLAIVALDMEVQARVPLGCHQVAVGRGAALTGGSILDATHVLVGDGPLPIAADPTGVPLAVLVAAPGTLWSVVEQRGSRARIVRTLEHGVVRGWVDAARLSVLPGPMGHGYGCGTSACGCGGVVSRSAASSPAPAYVGPARLRVGATLRGEGRVGFARARAPIEVRVRIELGAVAAAVLEVSGLTSHARSELPDGITVALDELDLPRGALP